MAYHRSRFLNLSNLASLAFVLALAGLRNGSRAGQPATDTDDLAAPAQRNRQPDAAEHACRSAFDAYSRRDDLDSDRTAGCHTSDVEAGRVSHFSGGSRHDDYAVRDARRCNRAGCDTTFVARID